MSDQQPKYRVRLTYELRTEYADKAEALAVMEREVNEIGHRAGSDVDWTSINGDVEEAES